MAYKDILEAAINTQWMLDRLQPAIAPEFGIRLKAKLEMSSETLAELHKTVESTNQKVAKQVVDQTEINDSLPFDHMHVCYYQDIEMGLPKVSMIK